MTSPGPVELDEHDVHLCTLPLPIDVGLLVDLTKAIEKVARGRGLQPSVLLLDGTSRIVARKQGAPDRAATS